MPCTYGEAIVTARLSNVNLPVLFPALLALQNKHRSFYSKFKIFAYVCVTNWGT